jgi:hypothetical protein
MNGRNMKRTIPGNRMVALRLAAACAALLFQVGASAWAQSASPAPQNMLGVWQGFTQRHPSDQVFPPDPVVPVRSEVTSQKNRRINGLMEVGGIEPEPFNGTVTASDRVNLQVQHEDHHGVAKLDLHDFGGGAAILNGTLALLSPGGQMTDGSLLLLRPFAYPPDPIVPNPAGSYAGSFASADGARGGEISAQLVPVPDDGRPTSFTGQVFIVIGETRHTFELKGTINAAGRFIAIAQATVGHVIFDATWTPVPDDGRPMITGRHTLEMNDGTVHEGTFSMTAGTFR